jgi:hypothetical protein
MASQRPASITVLAILNLVGGGLGLICCTGCAGINHIASANTDVFVPAGRTTNAGASNNPFVRSSEMSILIDRQVPTVVPGYKAYVYGIVLVSFILDVLLIISGIGLLMMAYWGRNMAISYAMISLFTKLIMGFYLLVFVLGPVSTLIDKEAASNPQFAAMAGSMAGFKFGRFIREFGWLLPGIYPVILLILLLRPSVGQAFAQANRGRREDEDEDAPRRRRDFDDEDDQDRDRYR